MKHNTNANTMVVVDASLENYQQLIDGIRPGAKSFLLDLRSDGIKQIGELLQQHKETEVLHLLSHGSPGCLYLGNSQLSLDPLGDYASTLQKWKVKQLLLYGCNVAAGDAGEELMTKLQALTGASLAASTTRTGAAARGGNWKLEWRTPGMKTPLALSAEAQMAYGGILTISQQEYQALRALYQSTNGASWTNNTGWRDWNFNSPTPPDASVVNGWRGVTVANGRVTLLLLSDNQLTGSIPTELGNLSNLEDLWLSDNQLTGSIPTELGNLSNLIRLQLYSNQLTGSIPTELGNLSNLRFLFLYSNQLTGSIPTELGNLSNLIRLQLYSNQLTGSIPTELGNLSNLEFLQLSDNQLTGSIPQEVLDLRVLKRLENPPYVLTEIPDVQLLLGNNLNIDISANFGDINNNIDNYTATGLPGGVTINSRGVISGTPTTADTFTVTVAAIDGARNRGTDTFDIVIENSPPTDLELSNSSIDSNSPLGAVVGTFSTTDPNEGDSFTYMLVSGNNAFTIVGDQLLTNSSLDFETQSSYSIRVQTTDAGGLSYSEAFTINVNNVNSSPTDLVLSSSSIDSNSPDNAVVGTFSTTDPDSSDTFTYQLVGGASADDNDAFTIEGNSLQINSSPDFERKSSYSIGVQTTDSTGNSYSEALTISVNDVGESPTDLVLSSSSIDSNSPLGAVVGTLSTTDPDEGDSFTYMLGSGNNAFTIVGDQLLTNSSLDFETQSSYSLRVQTTDSASNSFEEVLTINVNDVGESPTDLVISSSSIDSNSPDNAVVGTFSTTDPDSSDTFTYQLVGGASADDNDAFTIEGNSLQINSSPDFERKSSYSIGVQTTDSTGNSYSEALTISVNDVGESPTDLVLSSSSIDSNSPLGAVVGTLSTTDPDEGDSFTYMLGSGNNAFTIVGDQLLTNSSLDFETQSSYSLRVQTTDSASNSFEEVLTINVNDVGESPTDLVISSSSIDSNSPDNAVVGTFSTTDPDSSDTFTYQLVGGASADDNDAFTIEGNSLQINSSPDFERKSSYSIGVQTTDSTGNSYSEALTISVNDVGESPTDLVLSSSSIDSNSPLGAVVGTLSTTDPDEGDSFTYMLGSGNNAFTIVGDQLLTNSSLDFETQSSYSLRVQTTDSASNSFEEVLTINVNDVGESPTDLVISSSSIDSNSPDNAVVGTFSTTDPDSSDTFTYQLVGGADADDNDAFTIEGNSLQINSSPDFETQSSYSIRVQTTDAGGLSYSEAFTINVNNVNSSPTDLNFSNTRQSLTLNPQPLTLSLFEKEEEDTLIGREGRDRVYGNHGRDRVYGNHGSDRLYEGSEANIFVLESDMMVLS